MVPLMCEDVSTIRSSAKPRKTAPPITFQLRQAFSMRALSDIAIELKEKLQPAIGFVEILSEQNHSSRYKCKTLLHERLRGTLHAIDHAVSNLAQGISVCAGYDEMRQEKFQMVELIEEIRPYLEYLSRQKQLKFTLKWDKQDVTLNADLFRIRSTCLNLAALVADKLPFSTLSMSLSLSRKPTPKLNIVMAFRVQSDAHKQKSQELRQKLFDSSIISCQSYNTNLDKIASLLLAYNLKMLNTKLQVTLGPQQTRFAASIPVDLLNTANHPIRSKLA